MNTKLKISISVVIIIAIIALNCTMLANNVKAMDLKQISQIDLHCEGLCEQLLKYKGIIVKTAYVEYYGENGINYPAYCIDKTLQRSIRRTGVYSIYNKENR